MNRAFSAGASCTNSLGRCPRLLMNAAPLALKRDRQTATIGAEMFVDLAVMFFNNLLAGGDPAADQRGQLVAHHAPAQWGEIFDVREEEPDRNVGRLADGLLGHGRAERVGYLLGLPKGKRGIAD